MLRLTDLLHAPVLAGGANLGDVADLGAGLRGSHPSLETVVVRARRGAEVAYSLGPDARIEPGRIDLGKAETVEHPSRAHLMLKAHVLDAQVVDLADKRVVRVGDVVLAESRPEPRLIGVEFGIQPLLRRLGLRRIAPHSRSETIDWADVHLASAPGHALQLRMPRARIHRLNDAELAELIARLPAPRAAEAIRATGAPGTAEPAAPVPRHRRRGRRFGHVLRARHRAPS